MATIQQTGFVPVREESLITGFTLRERLDANAVAATLSDLAVLVGGIIKNLGFLNSGYDLNHGKWIPPFTAKASRDDIFHVNDVSHLCPATTYACRGLS